MPISICKVIVNYCIVLSNHLPNLLTCQFASASPSQQGLGFTCVFCPFTNTYSKLTFTWKNCPLLLWLPGWGIHPDSITNFATLDPSHRLQWHCRDVNLECLTDWKNVSVSVALHPKGWRLFLLYVFVPLLLVSKPCTGAYQVGK